VSDVDELQRNWEIYAQTDPMWAILMDPEQRGSWDQAEFFATGKQEVSTVLDHLTEIGVDLRTGCALDFGCGMGRLSQALADSFGEVTGVDISPTMIEHARRLNRHGERVRYVVCDSGDLARLGDVNFDFIYTSIVLQHMEPRLARGYLAEFARLLAPCGVLVFQIPDRIAPGRTPRQRLAVLKFRLQRRIGLRTRGRQAARRLGILRGEKTELEAVALMTCVPETDVRADLEAAGLQVRDVRITNSTEPDFSGGLRFLEHEPDAGFVSKQYSASHA